MTQRETELLQLLGRVPNSNRICIRPISPLLREIAASRSELLSLVATGARAGDYSITVAPFDNVRFDRVQTSTSAPAVPSGAFDAEAIGKAARQYQVAERKEGREISATDAVAHVLKARGMKQSTATPQPGKRGDPFAAQTAARNAQANAQLDEVLRRYGNGK